MTKNTSNAENQPRASNEHFGVAYDCLRVVLMNRWVVGVLLAALAGKAALEPASAWITKRVFEIAGEPGFEVPDLVSDLGLLFVAIMAGITLFDFVEKLANKAVEVRLIITFQRLYLDGRQDEHGARDISQVIYGCEQAKKAAEVLYKESWKITVSIISVLVWQVSLGPEWIPLMLLSIIPALALAWGFGPGIQWLSSSILDLQSLLAHTTPRAGRAEFDQHQESWFRHSLMLELRKWIVEDGLNIVMWTTLVALILVSWKFDLWLLPDEVALGGTAAFAINARLLAKPLGDIGKVYSRWREAYPAASRVFKPQDWPDMPSENDQQ
ncbi:hypothetical protein [Halomonas llamarensis]|uniref:ABC transmembrane type-1 domain-containing protein n=1 Tax=Halomonas llamarensis TaxID=2945104 RepID=A0ABT0SWI5_9GAMM|nr:hypothetical protein [Halomonas llamarensis]MCL7931669.1 hypothetical protein [Halomonas llamarensis]